MTVAKKASATNRRNQRYNSPRLAFEVTAEHIAAGVRRHSSRCMVAQALSEAYPGFTGVTADVQTVRATDPVRQLRYIYLTPPEAALPIIQFDEGVVPRPFSVLLRRAAWITRNSQWGSVKGPRAEPVTKAPKRGGLRSGETGKKSASQATTKDASQAPTKPEGLGRARIQPENSGGRGTPTVIGGHPPAYGALLGRAEGASHAAYYKTGNMRKRRVFGLRMLRTGHEAMLAELDARENTPRKKT
jgi:hypothetical protein